MSSTDRRRRCSRRWRTWSATIRAARTSCCTLRRRSGGALFPEFGTFSYRTRIGVHPNIRASTCESCGSLGGEILWLDERCHVICADSANTAPRNFAMTVNACWGRRDCELAVLKKVGAGRTAPTGRKDARRPCPRPPAAYRGRPAWRGLSWRPILRPSTDS